MSTPIFDALLAEQSPDRRAVVLIGIDENQIRTGIAWAEFFDQILKGSE